MTELHQRCYNKVTVECSRNVMEDLGISYEESKLYAMNSFSKKDKLVENMFTSKYSFEDFIKKDTETKAAEAERVFKEAEQKFRAVVVHVNKVSAAYRNLKAGNFALARQVLRSSSLGSTWLPPLI